MAPSARDGEPFRHVSDQVWSVAWHPPPAAPLGRAHGASALCIEPGGGIVLVSADGKRWGWPGGRPEEGESWEDTLRREVFEEACATVQGAHLIGFTRAVCEEGHERGLVLVRSIWRAEVELLPWEPRFEIEHRRVVPAAEVQQHLSTEDGFGPINRRALAEAGLVQRD